jgi:hypothetical protein
MSSTISSYDSKQLQLNIPYKNKEYLFCFIYLKLKENIYNKIEFLESISKNTQMLDVFRDAMFLSNSSHYNIIQMFIEDKDFNIVINERLVRFLVVFFDSQSYNLLTQTINDILGYYIIKSQYLEASTTNDRQFHKKEKHLINITYFLIELFNQKFRDAESSKCRDFVISKIIYVLDIGIINFYEEKEMRKDELRMIRVDILDAIHHQEKDILVSEKKDLLKRRLVLDKLLDGIYFSIEQVIDFLTKDFYKIKHKELYNIIYIYKKNNPFFYKNIYNFITFSKQVMQALITHNYTFIMEYSNFYFDLCIDNNDMVYRNEISTPMFIGTIFNVTYHISKTDIDIEEFILKMSKIVTIVEQTKPILHKIYKGYQKKICYVVLDKLKEVYSNSLKYYKSYNIIQCIRFLEQISKEVLLSYELRNIYIENIFFILDNIFKKKKIDTNKIEIATLINICIEDIISTHYNSILNYFSSDINILSEETWNNYIDYFGHNNYLLTHFYETVRNQLNYKSAQEHKKDPICSSIIEIPVKIPETDIYMDRYIISRCLMEKEENPFNRKKLTLDEINNI